jgi:hypothetical protein
MVLTKLIFSKWFYMFCEWKQITKTLCCRYLNALQNQARIHGDLCDQLEQNQAQVTF